MGLDSLPWFYVPSAFAEDSPVWLEEEEWHHCHHVMRLKPGDLLLLFNGRGGCMTGTIIVAERNKGLVQLTRDVSGHFDIPRTYKLSIGLSLTKNIDRTEFAVEKLVELGVDAIMFLDCEHSERSHLRMDRIEKCVISAAKQSRKIYLPVIQPPQSPAALTKHFQIQFPHTLQLACHQDEFSKSLADNYTNGEDVLLLVGPEGGFSTGEISQMKSDGVLLISLGPYRLRVETAAIRACVTVHVLNEKK